MEFSVPLELTRYRSNSDMLAKSGLRVYGLLHKRCICVNSRVHRNCLDLGKLLIKKEMMALWFGGPIAQPGVSPGNLQGRSIS